MALVVRAPSRSFWTWSGGCPHPCLSPVPSMADPERPCPFSLVASQAHSIAAALPGKHTSGGECSLASCYVLTIYSDCSSCFPNWGMSAMYVVCLCAEFWGLSLPALASKCVACPLPHLCVTHSSPSHPASHTHLLPQAHHVIIPALLETPHTHILSPLQVCCTLAALKSQVSVRNDSHHVPLDLKGITWQWLEPGVPQAEILSLIPLPEDLQSCCWEQAVEVWRV